MFLCRMKKEKAKRDAFGRYLPGSHCLRSRGGLHAWRNRTAESKAARVADLHAGHQKLQRIYALYKIFRSCGYPPFRNKAAFKLFRDIEPNYTPEDIEQLRGVIQRRYRQGWDIYAVLEHLMDGDL